MKAPRDYAPTAGDSGPVLRRRNQILALMAAAGVHFTRPDDRVPRSGRLPAVRPHAAQPFHSSAVVEHVLDELERHIPSSASRISCRAASRCIRPSTAACSASPATRWSTAWRATRRATRGPRRGARLGRRAEEQRRQHPGRDRRPAGLSRPQRRPTATSTASGSRCGSPVGHEADRLPRRIRAGRLHARDAGARRAHQCAGRPRGRQKWISNYDGRFKGLIPIREGARRIEKRGRDLDHRADWDRRRPEHGPQSRRADTAEALSDNGAGRVGISLLELATAYRTIASGVVAEPHVIRQVLRGSGDTIGGRPVTGRRSRVVNDGALALHSGGPARRRAYADRHRARAASESFPLP